MYTLIVARGYPQKKYPLYGIFEFDQAKALVRAGCTAVFAVIDYRSIRRWRKWGIEYFIKDGVTVAAINIPCGALPRSIAIPVATWGFGMLFRYIVKKMGRPDVIHAHFTDYALIASTISKKESIPLVITEHSSEVIQSSLDKNRPAVAKKTYDKVDAIIAVSPALAATISEKYGKKSRYIPNIIDMDIFNYVSRDARKGFHFISVGNLIERKRMDLTIQAFHKAFQHQSDIYLTICGDGPERNKLEKLIAEYGLEKRITLKGLCSRQSIAVFFNESDAFVLASRAESFGVAYVEALATGLPIIATKCSGVNAFIQDSNGLLVEIDDLCGLSEAMHTMVQNYTAYDARGIALDTRSKFSSEPVARQLMDVYKSVTGLTE